MPRRNRFAEQAALEALLRFGPEASGLGQLERAAQRNFRTSVRQARGTARGIRSAVAQERPRVQAAFDQAARTPADVNAVIGADMAGVPASMRAAIAQEQAGFTNRLEESRAHALTDLSDRRIRAREGKALAVNQAQQQFVTDLQDILTRRQDLAREQGAFTALTERELRTAAQERADKFALKEMDLTQSERNSLRSAGIDPDTGRPVRGGRDWASQAQHAAAQDQMQEAMRWAEQLKKGGLDRSDVAAALSSGREARPVYREDATGKQVKVLNRDGTPKMTGEIPRIGSQLLLSAALDQVFDGHLSRQNARRLRSRRLRLRDLPVTPYRQWLRERRGTSGVVLAPGANGQLRPT